LGWPIWRAIDAERNVESLQVSREVSRQLPRCFDKDRVGESLAIRIACHKLQQANGRRGGFEHEIIRGSLELKP
jgi:hypothetical protein